RYRADDPHLLGWVSGALTSSFLAAHAAYAPHRLDPTAADAFVAEQSRAAALLDPRVDLDTLTDATPLPMVDDGTLPQDVTQLRTRLRAYRPELQVTSQGRAALRFLLWPSLDPLVRAAYLPMVSGALATVDPDLRRLLGVPVGRVPAAALTAHTRALLALWRAGTGTSPVVRAAGERARRPSEVA
ncbi:MAG TPA: oxygenase MpaB family protein, partial [Nitriliruptorales bacterium]|nr:oxygenase MpaB family protein [Nitriliruptorales bacterium]